MSDFACYGRRSVAVLGRLVHQDYGEGGDLKKTLVYKCECGCYDVLICVGACVVCVCGGGGRLLHILLEKAYL